MANDRKQDYLEADEFDDDFSDFELDAVTNQMPPMAEEMGNMIDISEDKK